MGNCTSAANIVQVELGMAPSWIRVVHAAEARVVDVELPASQATMSVGELMLEFPPGHFLAHLDISAPPPCIGKPASPLGADAEAMPGPVYVLFPMPRLHARITSQELLSLAKLLHDPQLPKAAGKVAPRPPKLHRLFTRSARVAPLADHCTDDHILSSASAIRDNEQVICCPLTVSHPSPIAPESLQQNLNEQDSIISSSTFMRSCHGPMQTQVIRSKPWAPKLETILEG